MNSRELSSPHFEVLFQKGDMFRQDSRNNHSCEAFLLRFLSNEVMEEEFIFIHMWGVTGLQEEDEASHRW